MLAETFEDSRMKFIAEKVRHNPVEMAYHAEGANWEFYATSAGKTKFWGTPTYLCPNNYRQTSFHRKKSGDYSLGYDALEDWPGPLSMVGILP